MKDTRAINRFLIGVGLRVRSNPAISPDLCLDPHSLEQAVRADLLQLGSFLSTTAEGRGEMRRTAGLVDLFPASEVVVGPWRLFVVEERTTGDAGLLVAGDGPIPLPAAVSLGDGLQLVPLLWEGLAPLKNLLMADDPGSTVFPVARGTLSRSSLGIGARFTTLHWPAVAWAMKELGLSLTANQNSIPRELVYDVDAMLEGRLVEVPFPFIGGTVPEGHQGQSVEGMTHAAVVSYLKGGFHRRRIPWGFNADHQPIGGRFDAIEEELVQGCAFASYITFDLSPELAVTPTFDTPEDVARAFTSLDAAALFGLVLARLAPLGLSLDESAAKRLFVTLLPAMRKLVRRDEAYARVRRELFTTELGRRYFRELSIDELPGRTSPETLAACLALAEALGVEINYVAPAIGFQKNFPYPDDVELRRTVESLTTVARAFGVSIGFHSGSGKSAGNYAVAGDVTRQGLEIKTSGRYTYEMGVALSRSTDLRDAALWNDWYGFTRDLAVEGAFAGDPVRQRFAREFVGHALAHEGRSADGAFASPEALQAVLGALAPSPDHMFFFEYNFLYVLAARGSTSRLGDHGVAGYTQRARFYGVSDEARLLYAKGVAGYILFLAETTGLAPAPRVAAARERLAALPDHDAFERDLVA
ncbi:MAG TPA: tagaturonate epimerase family protein [Thermoanaerobaculia bacterium]|nr:tagaturonate epimerase family protein [Thermoanaerobaculia bacterium]